MTKIAALVRYFRDLPVPKIDGDALVRGIGASVVLPADALRSPAEVAAFRKRSAAAKLGWRRRKRRAKQVWKLPRNFKSNFDKVWTERIEHERRKRRVDA